MTLSSPLGFPRRVRKEDLRCRQFAENFLRRAVKKFSLLGQNEPARMPVKSGTFRSRSRELIWRLEILARLSVNSIKTSPMATAYVQFFRVLRRQP